MAPEMVADEKAKVEATGRMPSIEMEPKTLTLDQLKFARVCIYICIESYIYPRSVYIRRISTASYMIPLDFECSSLSLSFLFFSFQSEFTHRARLIPSPGRPLQFQSEFALPIDELGLTNTELINHPLINLHCWNNKILLRLDLYQTSD